MTKKIARHNHTIFRKTCADCKALQTECYQKLKDTGFDDWELRTDADGNLSGELNDQRLGSGRSEIEATLVSLESAEYEPFPNDNIINAALSENLDTFGEPTTIWDTPIAEQWRFFSSEVQSLPLNHPKRAFLLKWVELGGDVLNAARQTWPNRTEGSARWHGREAVRKFKLSLRKLGRLT